MNPNEQVLCVPSEIVHDLYKAQNSGFLPGFRKLENILNCGECRFVARGQCEEDETLKQISLYSVFRCRFNVFAYRRGKSGGDQRLFTKWSVGVGGHASFNGMAGMISLSMLEAELMREINEEIRLDSIPLRVERMGLVNDDSDPIGRVHLGVVHLWTMAEEQIAAKEDCLTDGRWVDPMKERDREWEGWSKIVLANLGRFAF